VSEGERSRNIKKEEEDEEEEEGKKKKKKKMMMMMKKGGRKGREGGREGTHRLVAAPESDDGICHVPLVHGFEAVGN